MLTNCIYTKKVLSKTNDSVYLFDNGKSFYSLYNTQKDVDNFLLSNNYTDKSFICIFGLGNGYHIKRIRQLYPNSFIMVIEANDNTVKFLSSDIGLQEFFIDKMISFSTIDKFKIDILNNFKPAIYEKFYCSFVRSWIDYFNDHKTYFQNQISEVLSLISNDYSVQSYFGKMWMKNIFSNLTYLQNKTFTFDCNKTAAIIAAGPSLDDSIKLLKENKDNFYIISTDTALPKLIQNDLIPDAFISIDAQIFSHEHFIGINKLIFNKILPVIDICANNSVLTNFYNKNDDILFFSSGHPLIKYFENIQQKQCIMHLNSGRGTVTSAAVDFSIQIGFTKICLFGADFSFYNNKSYSNDTYIYNKFLTLSSRLSTYEYKDIALQFRTPIINQNNKIRTTQLLSEYKNSLLEQIQKNKSKFYSLPNTFNPLNFAQNISPVCTTSAKISIFQKKFEISIINELSKKITQKSLSENEIIALLPFYAWCKTKKIDKFTMLNLANKYIDNYTRDTYDI